MSAEVLSRRALNRATLERQLLLRRAARPAADAVAHLVGLQAQVPENPYVALWSRLDRFDPAELSTLLEHRHVVRIVVMRATIHLVTAADCLALRPLFQPVLDREMARHRDYAPVLHDPGLDVDAVVEVGRRLLSERPLTGGALRAKLAERFPGHEPGALALACRNRLGLVQVPPRGLWGRSGGVTLATAEAWLGRPLATAPSLDGMVLRYLAAFGPATAADACRWSGLTGLGEVLDRLRPRLRTFRDERGRELFDVPDGPRPDPAAPAPPRFLPEYDNVLLSHADRSRFAAGDEPVGPAAGAGLGAGSLLVDGIVHGSWRVERTPGGDRAVLVVTSSPAARPLASRRCSAVEAEGRRLLGLLAPQAAEREVRLRESGR